MPVDVAIGRDGTLYVLCSTGGVGELIKVSWDDENLGTLFQGMHASIVPRNLEAGEYNDDSPQRPVQVIMDGDENLFVSDEASHRITMLTTEGEILGYLGEYGDGDGQLDHPAGIAFDAEENLYVVDAQNHRVQKLTRDGEFLMKWGVFGDGPGEFNMPWGIAVDELGDVYVADWRNDRVQKFTADGESIFAFGKSGSGNGVFNRPTGVAVDSDGDIYVADWLNNRVQLFSAEGRYVEKFIGDATLSRSAREFMLAQARPNRLREMTDLEPQKRLRRPKSVRVDGQGRMYIPDNGNSRVQVYQKEAIPLEPHQIAPPIKSSTLSTA